MSAFESKAYRDGCAANEDGQFNTQCPYEDDEQFSQWQAGWNDTEAHRIEQEEDRRREVNFHGYA